MSGTTALIFGNQLYAAHPALAEADRALLVESQARLRRRNYHAQKRIFILAALRHYVEKLRSDDLTVDHQRAENFGAALKAHLAAHQPERIIALAPAEYDAQQALAKHGQWLAAQGVRLEVWPDTVGFTCTPEKFAEWAAGKRGLLMENFYRWQRARLGVLMDGDEPVGGRWNLDAENRRGPQGMPPAPPLPHLDHDALTAQTIAEVRADYPDAFGQPEPFIWPVTHAQAEMWLTAFIDERLANFGPYEDAMDSENQFLFHGALALLLNIGLLEPRAVVARVQAAFEAGAVPLQSAEGFIRQIIGWREYVHGIYWLHMPEYRQRNYFDHSAPLPAFFWSADTNMRCLSDTVADVKKFAYTHHIPRLMLLANFGNLAGLDPAALTEWFLTVYIDAYDWVMWPNVLGLGLFADGGLTATKPYVAAAAYIKKMSAGYCNRCVYNPNQRTGAKACPFNALYWDFLARHGMRLRGNHRMAMMLRSAANRPDLAEIRARAAALRAEWESEVGE
jgi:deoxyribodipyrimidine photolyase-related protein